MKNQHKLHGRGLITISLMLFSLILGFVVPINHASNLNALAQSGNKSLYLPHMIRKFPMETVFGADLIISNDGGLSMMTSAGITWARLFIPWKYVEPNEGDRNWIGVSGIETQMKNAFANNIKPIVIIGKAPSWALINPTYNCSAIKAEKMNAFARFLSDAVKRYSQPPYSIKYWELWNEPDVAPAPGVETDSGFGCWGDGSDPYFGGGYYAEMLKIANPAIKAADPQAQLLMGGLLLDCDPNNPPAGKDCTPTKFFEGVLRNGGGPLIDGVSFHAYEYYYGKLGSFGNTNWRSSSSNVGTAILPKVAYLKSLLNKPEYNASGKYLIASESALVCTNCTSDPDFETTKAYYLARSYADGIASGLRGNIWYAVSGWRNSQLLNWYNVPTPAYIAYKYAYKQLSDATFIKSLDFGGVKGYEFQRDSTNFWLVWALTGSQNINLPVTPKAVNDVLGNPVSFSGNILNVTMKPVYIVIR